MKPVPMTFRLFAEILSIIVYVEFAVMDLLGRVGWEQSGQSAGVLMDAGLLVVLSGPLILWRVEAAARRAGRKDQQEPTAPSQKKSQYVTRAIALGVLAIIFVGSILAGQQVSTGGQEAAMLVSTGGMIIGILLALMVWSYGTSRSHAMTLATQMTSDLSESEREARTLIARLKSYWDALDQQTIIAVTDCSGKITQVNDLFTKISGYSQEELIGQDHRIINSGYHPKSFWIDCWRTVAQGEIWRGEVCNRAKDGSLYWVNSSIGPVCDAEGTITGYVAVRVDITEQKRAEEQLRKAAYADDLTGLANRTFFLDTLRDALAATEPGAESGYAVLFIDIDRFKFINDTIGHVVGDSILLEIANRLRMVVGATTTSDGRRPESLLARFGGDEFAVLVDGITGAEDAAAVGEKLLGVFAEPVYPEGREIFLTASVGIAASYDPTDEAEEILRRADIAVYEAKLAGRGRQVQFESSMSERIERRLSLESDLRKALDAGEFFLVYQPIVSLDSHRVEGFEALIRWQHPTRGLVRPDEFIPAAEQTGLILPIGEWVLREACSEFARWRNTLGEMAPKHISINLSRNQLMQHDLVEMIRRVLKETGVEAPRLHIEITESAVMEDIASGTRMLNAIGEIGVKQSLDDFGTGHSSLASLHEFPVEVLKIDRSFVANIDRGRRFVALVHAAAQLASNLGMEVVAEGIEDADQVAVLQSMGCEFGQGYFFSKPMKAAEVPGFLTSWEETRKKAA